MKTCTIQIEDADYKRMQEGQIVKTKLDGVDIVIMTSVQYFKDTKPKDKKASTGEKESIADLIAAHRYDPEWVIVRSHIKSLGKQDNTIVASDALETLDNMVRAIISGSITIAKETAKNQSAADPKKHPRQIIVPVTVSDALAKLGVTK